MTEPTITNDWCRTLGIAPPKREGVVGHREANTFALLLVALLSLQRCKPGRPPVYRAVIDRLTYDAHIIETGTTSVRLAEALKRQGTQPQQED